MTDLTKDELFLLDWLKTDDGQYGECHGKALDGLVAKGLAVVGGGETGIRNGFIAKGTGMMYRAVSITDAGRDLVTSQDRVQTPINKGD